LGILRSGKLSGLRPDPRSESAVSSGQVTRTSSNYAVGQNASGMATIAESAFLGIWNPMDPRYRPVTYSGPGL
jgi:hypothetical protein